MVLVAPVLLAMCYKHQCKKHIASGTICYGVSDISIGHSGKVFCVLCPKISTGQKKLAPTGRHGRHVFAALGLSENLKSFGDCDVEANNYNGKCGCVS